MTSEQFFATSPDGTEVPYFVVHDKNIKMDGTNPTLLYGYGGFEISLNPRYSATRGKLWLENGGVYVLANIRGGGEYGPKWHQAGLKTDRQRIYDDFIAVAENLIDKGITSPKHLGIEGGSNGGLLMGVPVEGAFLRKISPYHNIDPEADYPEVFFVTSTKDDRVHPGHARKVAKRMEDQGHDFLYYENIDGGHSARSMIRLNSLRLGKLMLTKYYDFPLLLLVMISAALAFAFWAMGLSGLVEPVRLGDIYFTKSIAGLAKDALFVPLKPIMYALIILSIAASIAISRHFIGARLKTLRNSTSRYRAASRYYF